MKRKMKPLVETITLDASVVVKWFKKGEAHEEESLSLRDAILTSKIPATTSEWLLLEVVRGLVRANYPREKVDEAYSTLREMTSVGFIEALPIREVMDEAKGLEIDLSLFASDAVYLATAILTQAALITEDRHLLDKHVVKYAQERGVKITALRDTTW
ncbi:MAG: type II toxin-antitoxin system VapC family toxin [Candidatus Bathyarchaeia archaeon]